MYLPSRVPLSGFSQAQAFPDEVTKNGNSTIRSKLVISFLLATNEIKTTDLYNTFKKVPTDVKKNQLFSLFVRAAHVTCMRVCMCERE